MCRRSIVLLVALSCSGCAFQSQVNRATVNYNEAVAAAANELTLLNVIRAMKRYPLHFTTVSKISGSFKFTGRTGIGVDVNQGGGSSKFNPAGELVERTASLGPEKLTPSASAEVSGGPSFDIGVLDTQEFYQGILAPIDPAMIGNFLNLGWPDDLVAAMLVERIEFHVPKAGTAAPAGRTTKSLAQLMAPPPYGGPEAVWVLENNATSDDFGRFVRCFKLRPSARSGAPTRLWPVAKMGDFKVADLALLDGEKLSLSGEEDPSKRWVQRVRPEAKGLTFRDVPLREGGLADAECRFLLVPEHRGQQPRTVSVDIYHREGGGAAAPTDAEHGDAGGEVVAQLTLPGEQEKADRVEEVAASVHIVLRSAQAVLYYLGEYAREEAAYRLRRGARVITVRPGRDGDAFLTARLNGATYSIPGDPGQRGRSATAIDLAQQLVNLNKSAKDKPATASFRVIE